ncbi:P-loop NTPase fold protein [Nonomuraea sp. NPDC050556]|uniref:P-loop NTPase fold protein n=1 Tax=Nonomuraea sp. NPDC050556 TaxID=3364369 RepID=UPI0037BCF109
MATPAGPQAESAVAQILDKEGRLRGAGVLVAPDLVLTCAHVIEPDAELGVRVQVGFPFSSSGRLEGEVVFSLPPEPKVRTRVNDLAGIRLIGPLPTDLRPAKLVSDLSTRQRVRIYGFPSGWDDGAWAAAETVGGLPGGLFQLGPSGNGRRVERGFSGAPVWSEDGEGALGIVVSVEESETSHTALMYSTDTLLKAWPELGQLIEGPGEELSTAPPPPATDRPPREQTQWVSDAPAEDDALKRDALASVLAKQLRHARGETPDTSFLVHVDGAWGTGKSTLLNLLAARLRSDSLVISFDAWRHVRVDPPWWALLAAVRAAVTRDLPGWRRPLFRVRETFARVGRDGSAQLASALLLIATAAALFWLGAATAKGIEDAVKTATTAAAAIGGLWAAGLFVSRYVMWESPRRARSFEQSHTNPMNDVAEHFAWLVRRARRPMVIFVEDLDRCDATYVVAFLDSVQTLMRDVPGHWRGPVQAPSFVVAMDGVWLRCAYEKAYDTFAAAVGEPGRPLGYLFLDKLFQLSVPMPRLGQTSRDQYFSGLLGVGAQRQDLDADVAAASRVSRDIAESRDEVDVLLALARTTPQVRRLVAAQAVERISDADVRDVTVHALAKFSALLHSNPRAMKRFVNTYTVLRAARVLEGAAVPTDALALWTVLRIRWPRLADHLESVPEAITAISAGRDGDLQGIPEDVRGLAAAAELRDVLRAVPGVELTPELIRACSGAADAPELLDGG